MQKRSHSIRHSCGVYFYSNFAQLIAVALSPCAFRARLWRRTTNLHPDTKHMPHVYGATRGIRCDKKGTHQICWVLVVETLHTHIVSGIVVGHFSIFALYFLTLWFVMKISKASVYEELIVAVLWMAHTAEQCLWSSSGCNYVRTLCNVQCVAIATLKRFVRWMWFREESKCSHIHITHKSVEYACATYMSFKVLYKNTA